MSKSGIDWNNRRGGDNFKATYINNVQSKRESLKDALHCNKYKYV